MNFPLPWEHVHLRTRRYAVSDVRFVRLRRGRVAREIALYDIASVSVFSSALERVTGIGTLVIRSSRAADSELRIPGVPRARQAALRLSLLIADIRGVPPGREVDALPLPAIWRLPMPDNLRIVFVGPALILVTLVVVVIGLSGYQGHVAFGPDDPIRPNGIKRNRADIDAFMESEVMPWARKALEPIVGKGKVTCKTCHGENAEARAWAMPAVAALPEPAVRSVAPGADSQVRNALHGYEAESDKQRKATHMRGIVLPGMAALLRRPVYDFAGTYEQNRQRAAFGCYHCHRVKD